MKKTRSLKKELIYSFLTIALVSILSLGAFQIVQLSSLIKENQENQIQTTAFLADYVHNYMEEYKRVIQTQAMDMKSLLPNGEINKIEQQLANVKSNYPGFINLYVADSTGKVAAFYPEIAGDGKNNEELNFSDRAYFKEMLKEKDTVISSVFPGRGGTNQQLVTIATPVLNEKGEMESYLLGALDLTALQEHIHNQHFGSEGTSVVLDQEYNVVLYPGIKNGTENMNLQGTDIIDFIEEKQRDNGAEYFTLDNSENYVTYEKLNELGWTVWIEKPATIITDTYKDAIITIIIFILVTTVLMVGLSFFFTNRLETTMRHLLNYMKAYTADFKANSFVSEKIKGPKEMQELSSHFNYMIKEIERKRIELVQLNTELEGKVLERTATLADKNMELKAVNKLITSVSSEKDLAHFIQYCLQEIEPIKDYNMYVLFEGFIVSHDKIVESQETQYEYKRQVSNDQQYIEPILIEKEEKGFLVVHLKDGQTIASSEQEFLETFASSLAIMLQNKFLFERFRNKHAELEAVLESMSEGLLLLNNQKQVEYVNEFFVKALSGESLEDSKFAVLDDVYEHIRRVFAVDTTDLTAFFASEYETLKLEYKQASDKSMYYMLHKFSVTTEDGKIGEGLLLHDITKEEEIDTLKNNLISLTSHEFKTPITTIKGSVETLLRSEVEWEPAFQQELLEGVHEDIERIQHLVNDWMDISKIESGTMYVDRNMIRADHVIEQSLEQIPIELRENASFQFRNNTEEYLFFFADKLRVQQVLVNLFTNALRYNDAASKSIEIILDEKEDFITIAVSDNGIGIASDHLDSVFNRFYQVDVTATRRRGGTGLGLAICKGIMEAHDGKIEVESTPGQGSTFTLYFPKQGGI